MSEARLASEARGASAVRLVSKALMASRGALVSKAPSFKPEGLSSLPVSPGPELVTVVRGLRLRRSESRRSEREKETRRRDGGTRGGRKGGRGGGEVGEREKHRDIRIVSQRRKEREGKKTSTPTSL